jgi:uncharacterized protein (DUF362 family)
MNTKPRVTIGIPFFNTGGRVHLAVQSVLRQTFHDWELLMVDDGSTDVDSGIGPEYIADSRIRCIRDGRHLGLPARLNYIAEAARGEFLARMDGDDIMHPDRIAEQVAYLEAHPQIDVLGTDAYIIDEDNNVRGRSLTEALRVCSRLSYLRLTHPTVMGRREWFRKNPYSCDYPRCEDKELWIRTSGNARLAVIHKPLLFYNLWSFRADKARLSLRQYQQILSLHKARICLHCRIRAIASAEIRRVGCSILERLGMVNWYLQRSCVAVEPLERDASQTVLRAIIRDAERTLPLWRSAARCESVFSHRGAPVGCRGVSVVYGEYGTEAPYNPPADAPELRQFSAGQGQANKAVYPLRRIFLANGLDHENYGTEGWNPLRQWVRPGMKIVLKPNWVRHEAGSLLGQNVVCTHPSLIRALIDYCLIALNGEGEITVADSPLQGADFSVIAAQQGISRLQQYYDRLRAPVRFVDLRMEWAELAPGTGYIKARHKLSGDPKGYSIIDLGGESALSPLAESGARFAVGDYDSRVTSGHHAGGRHEYCISNTVLESDVLISVPKLKTHVKAALTCALKNMIGINCSKDYLAHYRSGSPKHGGDEYPDGRLISIVAGKLRPMMQGRSPLSVWKFLQRISRPGIRHVVRGGDWPGNDTMWRTIYDVVRIAQNYGVGQAIRKEPRTFLTFVDAIVCGEGDGPLRPTPVKRNLVLFGEDPGMVDCAAAEVMGFDWASIPLLQHLLDEKCGVRTRFSGTVDFTVDERSQILLGAEIKPIFAAPTAWQKHITPRKGVSGGAPA